MYNRFVRLRAQKPGRTRKGAPQKSANATRMCAYKTLKNARKQRTATTTSPNHRSRTPSCVQFPFDPQLAGYRRSGAYADPQLISVSGERITSQKYGKVSSCERLASGDVRGALPSRSKTAVTNRNGENKETAVFPQTGVQMEYPRTDSREKRPFSTERPTDTVANDGDVIEYSDKPTERERSVGGSDVMLISNVTSLDALV